MTLCAVDPDVERDDLSPDETLTARALRDAARVVGAAALPSQYRQTAFAVIAPMFIRRAHHRPEEATS